MKAKEAMFNGQSKRPKGIVSFNINNGFEAGAYLLSRVMNMQSSFWITLLSLKSLLWHLLYLGVALELLKATIKLELHEHKQAQAAVLKMA